MKRLADEVTARRRDLLYVRHLPLFRQFCEERGWIAVPPKGYHEVLRMKRPKQPSHAGTDWLIVHQRDFNLSGSSDVQHATVWGFSTEMAEKFYAERKHPKSRALAEGGE